MISRLDKNINSADLLFITSLLLGGFGGGGGVVDGGRFFYCGQTKQLESSFQDKY